MLPVYVCSRLHGQNTSTKVVFSSLEMQRIMPIKELSGNEEDHIQVIQNCKIEDNQCHRLLLLLSFNREEGFLTNLYFGSIVKSHTHSL